MAAARVAVVTPPGTPRPVRHVVVPAVLTVVVSAALVAGLDQLLLARVRAGTDDALRLSVILPYLGVDGSYVLARALGLTALVTAAASVLAGLHIGRRRLLEAPVLPATATVHRVAGIVTVALVAAHATVPYLSAVPPFGGWATALAPFGQPFSWGTRATVFESLGIVAFYLLFLVGPTYYLLGRRARLWPALHRLSVAAYVLAVLHALFLGSDVYVAGPLRVTVVAVQVPVGILLAARLWAGRGRRRRAVAAVSAGAVLAGSAALVVLAGLGVAGDALGGLRL